MPGTMRGKSETARAARVDRLTQPDGWLALIGLPSLPSGTSTIGRAADNRIVLAVGPDRFGTITEETDGRVTFAPAPGAGAFVDGATVSGIVELRPGDVVRRPTLVTAGTVGFYLVESGGGKTLHVRDVARPQFVDFPGLDYFPVDPAWRIETEWVALAEPRTRSITDIAGGASSLRQTGKAVFSRNGRTFELIPLENPDGSLLFVFTDATSDTDTYAMRFLDAARPANGKVVLDFNLAENRPAPFRPLAVCPLPPAENRLPFAITAGERIFHNASP